MAGGEEFAHHFGPGPPTGVGWCLTGPRGFESDGAVFLVDAIPFLAVTGSSAGAPGSGSWALLITYFVMAIGVSFFCSVWEAVLLSITQPYIESKKGERPRTGALLESLKSNLNAPLTSILTLNTIAHTVGAMGVGAQVAALTGGGWVEHLAGALMTLAILILSEIIPKNLGARHWRAWAPWVGRCLAVLSKIMMPFVKLVEVFAPGGHGQAEFNREELKVMGEMGRKEGKLKESEMRILHNLLHLRDNTVHDVMTPRVVVFALPQSMTVGQFMEEHGETPFSRIPIYEKDLDDLKGFVLKDDVLLAAAYDRHAIHLGELVRELPRLSATTPVPKAFEGFVSGRNQIAVVLDEFGGCAGVVTMEDVVETLLGLEIVDEVDTTDDMQQRARMLWKRRAERMGLSLEELEEHGKSAGGDEGEIEARPGGEKGRA
jgi:CBS domain containing-hemolysin-like protein